MARTVKTAVLANFFNAHISRLGLKTAFYNRAFFAFSTAHATAWAKQSEQNTLFKPAAVPAGRAAAGSRGSGLCIRLLRYPSG